MAVESAGSGATELVSVREEAGELVGFILMVAVLRGITWDRKRDKAIGEMMGIFKGSRKGTTNAADGISSVAADGLFHVFLG